MSIFERAKQVNPSDLGDHESKVIWTGSAGIFCYLIREGDYVYLRMTFSQAQLAFYVLINEEWDITTETAYKEITELWQLEKEQLAKKHLSQQSFLT